MNPNESERVYEQERKNKYDRKFYMSLILSLSDSSVINIVWSISLNRISSSSMSWYNEYQYEFQSELELE